MKVIKEQTLQEFEAWGDAISAKQKIIEAGKEQKFEEMVESLNPKGITDTNLNDVLSNKTLLFQMLGIKDN